nr:S8 family serine peptidase [Desulfobulbaceae bacterium]
MKQVFWVSEWTSKRVVCWRMLLILFLLLGPGALKAAWGQGQRMYSLKVPHGITENLKSGRAADIIVLFDAEAVEDEVRAMRQARGIKFDDKVILDYRAQRYRQRKEQLFATLPMADIDTLAEYRQLPLTALRLHSLQALEGLSSHPQVLAVYPDEILTPTLNQSLPLTGQPAAVSAGMAGNGTTAAVIDTGVDWTNNAFGDCTAPGIPAETCKIKATVEMAPDDGMLDSTGHGTNVAGVVTGVAPGTGIVSFDVFDQEGFSSSSLVAQAIDCAITNKDVYNIIVLNLSMEGGSKYTEPCENAFEVAFYLALEAGIIPVSASGNSAYQNQIFSDGLPSPACTRKLERIFPRVKAATPLSPAGISVGAVYDSSVGSRGWGSCFDSTTVADQIVCFSNSSSYLTLLAPGAVITAAGSAMSGTSQAAPHVSGAIALLRQDYPTETNETIGQMLTGNGLAITDPRNSATTPRLDLTVFGPPPEPPSVPVMGGGGLAVLILMLLIGYWLLPEDRKRESTV